MAHRSTFISSLPFVGVAGYRVFRLAHRLISITLFGYAIVGWASAQANASPAAVSGGQKSHQPPPTEVFEQFIPYWTGEAGWRSELQLRNNTNGDLTVTPAIRAASGAESPLPPITIKAQEVRSVDIVDTAPQFAGLYGSAVLRYNSSFSRAIYAAVMVRSIGHPIAFHLDALAEAPEFDGATREGIWWIPNRTASDYLVLTNQGGAAMTVDLSLYDSGGKEFKQPLKLAARQTSRYSFRDLLRSAGFTSSFGGIRVVARSHAGSLDTVHFMFDEQAGFSALLKMFDHDPHATIAQRDFAKTGQWTTRAPMLALSQPDSALAFPDSVRLQPQLFIRNTLNKPANANLRFSWRSAIATGTAKGPSIRFAPFETRRIDVGALQDGKVLPQEANWTSVEIITDTKPDEVIANAASYDSSLRYGAQTPFSDQLSFKWKGGMWEYDPQHDSIITAGNGSKKTTDAAFTIFYNKGADKYELQQTLQPDEQMWIDVGKLIHDRVPDKNGNVLPTDLTMGSYEFRDLKDVGIGSLYEGKVIYDRTYGSATYGCANCCGYYAPSLDFNPLGLFVGGLGQNGVEANDDCGDQGVNLDYYFENGWTTANHAIATVDGYGGHTGVGGGSTTTTTTGPIASHALRSCPVVLHSPSGGDNVAPTISSISPAQGLVGTATSVTITGTGFASGATVSAGSNISVSGVSVSSSTQMKATFTPTNSTAAGGNQAVTVTLGGHPSNSKNFYDQIPSRLSISTITSLVVITDGSVLDYFGNVLRTNRCGEYRNVVSNLLDQQGGTILGGNFTLTESFSNYSTTLVPNPGPPPTQSSTQNTAQQVLADTQFFGFVAPACPGSNDHEAFYQSFQITIGSVTFPLTTIYSIQRGEYSGTPTVAVTVNTP
jgi:hypothetical protein